MFPEREEQIVRCCIGQVSEPFFEVVPVRVPAYAVLVPLFGDKCGWTVTLVVGLHKQLTSDRRILPEVRRDFLRRVIDDSNRQQVPLGEELEFALKYLDIQKVRFAERLQVSVSVPSELFSTAVPSLILQPMVENAVKHGIAKRVQGGVIRIRAFPTDDKVTLSVYNDGPMLPQGWEQAPSGIGLANVRSRLQSLYGKEFEVNIHNREPGGVEVSISVPLEQSIEHS